MNRFLILFFIFIIISPLTFAQTFSLYAGNNYDTFLGCLNVSKFNSDSIWNQYGTYGSRYNNLSIWNQFGQYGSNYSSLSPWNRFASNPPAIMDENGDFYGYFTISTVKTNRTKIDWVLWILENYEHVRENLDQAYQMIFG